jgi:hypothetical protein
VGARRNVLDKVRASVSGALSAPFDSADGV